MYFIKDKTPQNSKYLYDLFCLSTVGNQERNVSLMISNKLVEVPHLPDIDAHAQQEGGISSPRRLSTPTRKYGMYSIKEQRAASVFTSGSTRGSPQSAVQRCTSADNGSKCYTDSVIYQSEKVKDMYNSSQKMSLMSPDGNEAANELANRNAQYSETGHLQVTTTLGHLLNTLDNGWLIKDKNPDSVLAMRECRYIRIYSPALKGSKAYKRMSSWNMPSSSENSKYLMSSR